MRGTLTTVDIAPLPVIRWQCTGAQLLYTPVHSCTGYLYICLQSVSSLALRSLYIRWIASVPAERLVVPAILKHMKAIARR